MKPSGPYGLASRVSQTCVSPTSWESDSQEPSAVPLKAELGGNGGLRV